MSNDKIAEVLGIRTLEEARKESLPDIIDAEVVSDTVTYLIPTDADADDTVRDIEQARGNIKNIIEQGDDALKEMMALAKQSESPRAFEVASTLMKTLLDANKDFVEMSTKKKYAKDELNGPKEAAQSSVTNNNLIISTADLLKMMKGDK